MKTIAYFDASHDMPVEIISAAGFLPYKILGDVHRGTDAADRYLAKFFCPAARSWLSEALEFSQQWQGIIFAHGCDATNRHFDVWKRHVETPFLHWFNSPLKNNGAAKRFFVVELKRMIEAIQKQYGITITDSDLNNAILASNRVRVLLSDISSLRSIRDIPNREYFSLIRSVLQPGENLEDELRALYDDWKDRENFPANKTRIYLTGSDTTYAEWMDLLEECSMRVVRDDLSTGERMFARLVPEDEAPLEALATYYLGIPRPATKVGIQGRIDFLLESLKETPVDGVLSQNLKFCEPFAYDCVEVNKALKEKGYRVMHFEREFTPLMDQQLTNRLSAFAETL